MRLSILSPRSCCLLLVMAAIPDVQLFREAKRMTSFIFSEGGGRTGMIHERNTRHGKLGI